MPTIEETFDFTAPAEVVFGVLTDPDRTLRWLPPGVAAELAGRERLRVKTDAGVREFALEMVDERMELRWRPLDGSEPGGVLRVVDAPAGGSVIHAQVEVLAGPAEQPYRDVLAEAMRHLQSDVSDNFNAG